MRCGRVGAAVAHRVDGLLMTDVLAENLTESDNHQWQATRLGELL